jgi:hypothetical protein
MKNEAANVAGVLAAKAAGELRVYFATFEWRA